MNKIELAVELGENGRAGYASIHRAGCKDLDDGEIIGTFEMPLDHAAVAAAIENETGWEVEAELIGGSCYKLANCTRKQA